MKPKDNAPQTNAFSLPQEWYVFGPVDSAHCLESNDFKVMPRVLESQGQLLRPQKALAQDNGLDLAPFIGGTADGRNAYVFIPFCLAEEQELAFSFGANWRFAAWIDGRPIADTLQDGNVAWPVTQWDHLTSASLAKGDHLLAIRFVSGSKSSELYVVSFSDAKSILHPKKMPEIPYPPSETIKGIKWLAEPTYTNWSGDVWSSTWARDGHIYTVADDSQGSNLAIDRVEGDPPNLKISRVNPMAEWGQPGQHGWWKGAGLTSIDGVLYLGIFSQSRPRPGGATKLSFCAYNSAIMKSEDYGKTWTPRPNDGPALFPLFPGREFPTPYFVQYGQDYSGAIDEFVYVVSNDGGWNNWNKMKLARIPRKAFSKLDLSDWEFFVRSNDAGQPVWTKHVLEAGSIFEHPGYTSMTGIQYVPAIKRFILGQWAYTSVKGQFDRTNLCPEKWPWGTDHPKYHFRCETMLCLYESPHPWGPWHCFHSENPWGPAYYCPNFPSKWFTNGGKSMWIVEGGNYDTGVRGYEFIVQPLELML